MNAEATTGGDARRDEYDRLVAPVNERVRRALVAHYGVEVGTDATADAMGWAWEHLDRLSGLHNPAGYLFRVGQSAARRHRRWHHATTGFPDGGQWVANNVPDLDDDLIDALKLLPSKQRVAVLLVHGYGFTYREVADILDVTEAAVTNHIHRGLITLRNSLDNGS
jgi:DNA-directed RNA polymerase specialized sigma24 family protein